MNSLLAIAKVVPTSRSVDVMPGATSSNVAGRAVCSLCESSACVGIDGVAARSSEDNQRARSVSCPSMPQRGEVSLLIALSSFISTSTLCQRSPLLPGPSSRAVMFISKLLNVMIFI